MDNGNFFPNMDQSQGVSEQPMSLNTMNNQTIGGQIPNTIPQPEQNPMPNFLATPNNQMGNLISNTTQKIEPPLPPMPEQPMVAPTPVESAMPEVPIVEPTIAPAPVTAAPEISEPTVPIGAPIVEPTIAPLPVTEPPIPEEPLPEVVPVTPVQEDPLPETTTQFSDPPLFGSAPLPEPNYEVPVTMPTEPISNEESKVTMVQDFLDQNGITYKSYSNSTGNCIIIEL